MIVPDLLVWWYGVGWADVLKQVFGRSRRVLEAFSVGLLARTLFAPFRQIDASRVRGSLNMQMHAWFDRGFSRCIGFLARSIVIVSGSVIAVVVACAGAVWAVVWLAIPILPVVGVFLLASGWTFG